MNLKRTAWTAASLTVAGAIGAGVLVFGATSAFADDDSSSQNGGTEQVVLKREDNQLSLVTVADDDLDADDPTNDGVTNTRGDLTDNTRPDNTNDTVNTKNTVQTKNTVNTRDNTRDDNTRDNTRDGVNRDLTPTLTRDNTR